MPLIVSHLIRTILLLYLFFKKITIISIRTYTNMHDQLAIVNSFQKRSDCLLVLLTILRVLNLLLCCRRINTKLKIITYYDRFTITRKQ